MTGKELEYANVEDYKNKVLVLARTLKTNGSNYISYNWEQLYTWYIIGSSIEDAALELAEYTEKSENKNQILGEQTYTSFEESREAALKVAKRLNKRDNNKWKTISMTKCGHWIAGLIHLIIMYLIMIIYQIMLKIQLKMKCQSLIVLKNT